MLPQSLLVALSQGECRSTLEHLAAENKVSDLKRSATASKEGSKAAMVGREGMRNDTLPYPAHPENQ